MIFTWKQVLHLHGNMIASLAQLKRATAAKNLSGNGDSSAPQKRRGEDSSHAQYIHNPQDLLCSCPDSYLGQLCSSEISGCLKEQRLSLQKR